MQASRQDRVRSEQERKLTRFQRDKDKKRLKTYDNWVRNISSHSLDKTETHLLSYRLKHSVKPKRIPTKSIVSSVEAILSRQRHFITINNIVILLADKGRVTVVMDKAYCFDKMDAVNDKQTYEELSKARPDASTST